MTGAATREALECTAFVNPDGGAALVAMNRSEDALRFQLGIDGLTYLAELPPRSIATFLSASV